MTAFPPPASTCSGHPISRPAPARSRRASRLDSSGRPKLPQDVVGLADAVGRVLGPDPGVTEQAGSRHITHAGVTPAHPTPAAGRTSGRGLSAGYARPALAARATRTSSPWRP